MVLNVDESETPQKEKEFAGYLPHINIDIFPLKDDVFSIMEMVSQDRRLTKAHVRLEKGGIEQAVAFYQTTKTPHLLIVEVAENADIHSELEKLAEVCDAETKVVVIGYVDNIVLYRELIRSGISEYLVPPFTPVEMISGLASLYKDHKSGNLGKVITFFGAKGGVGSSTLAHNIGHIFSHILKVETAVIDFDLAFGTLALDYNLEGVQTLFEALAQPDRVDHAFLERLFSKVGDRLNLLPSSATLDRELVVQSSAIDTLLEVMRADIPYILLDLPSLWTPWSKHILQHSDEIILTCTPDITCLRNLKNLIEFFKVTRPNDQMPRFFLNQVGVPNRVEIPVEEFAKALKVEMQSIAFEPKIFSQAAANGKMLVQIDENAEVVERLIAFSAAIVGHKLQEKPNQKSWIGSIVDRLVKGA